MKKDIFTIVAKKFGTNPRNVRKEIQKAIDEAIASPNPEIRAYWENIPKKGNKLTPEEAIEFLANELKKESSPS